MSTDDAGTAPKSSWKREVPSPWIDCESCGWRHYPDASRRRLPSYPETCTRCGRTLPPPPRDDPGGGR
jgi:hypothetical protein